ncbi:MAG: RNA methyltransferase [Clostridiales bacterium]|nr:RNA methyltransferase [Clostridiales bacterium]
MEIITSTDNKTVKRLNKLKQKKYRDEYGEFFVEGYKNVLDTCAAGAEVRYVVLSQSAYRAFGEKFADHSVVVLGDGLFDKITETQNSQGVLCVCAASPSAFPQNNRVVLLDRVRDPGNVGTILRTAVAFGYDVVLNNCCDVYSPKVVRSAMSAVVKCRIGRDISPDKLKRSGYELIVADMDGENITSANCADKYCIVIGNEADGVSDEIMKLADKKISIPQDNIESLNAAVAAAIMMFELKAR